MKNRISLLTVLTLVLMVVIMGCSSGGSSSGGGTTTTTTTAPLTDTQKLVGTWTFVRSTDGIVLASLIFRADGTGSWGTAFTNGRVTNGVFLFTLVSGQPEAFNCTFSNNDNTVTMTNQNGGASYIHNRAS
jgi:hypothetical protein